MNFFDDSFDWNLINNSSTNAVGCDGVTLRIYTDLSGYLYWCLYTESGTTFELY